MSDTDTEKLVAEAYEKALSVPIIKAAIDELDNSLSEELYYHSAKHTRDVLREVLLFSHADGLNEREIELLTIGAAYHDIGFLEKRVDNEWLAASRARKAMTEAGGYTETEINLVETMILDTQLVETSLGAKQIPSDRLGQYLLDADLGNLGREDFFEKAELLRQELGLSKQLFFKDAFKFLQNHKWISPAASKLRLAGQQENITKLSEYVDSLDKLDEETEPGGLDLSQLLLLARLPLLLNSSLNTERLVKTALEHLRGGMNAAAATVFQLDSSGSNLHFWALTGGEAALADKVIPADKGIVGWVIQNREPALVNDPKRDNRFYGGLDKEGGFDTVNLVCVPLIVRSEKIIGALQVLNKKSPEGFLERDLLLAERVAHQLALAIDNAELYSQSESMRKKLAQLDKRKGEMITVLTHELRTPLNVISGAADLLGMPKPLPEEQREKMSDTLARGVQRLVNLSQQLQSLARVQGENIKLQRTRFPIQQVMTAVKERYKSIAEIRKIKMKVEGDKLFDMIEGDESLIFLVLSNLLSNAIRFTDDNGEIRLSAETEHGLVKFSVQDTGIGIAEEEIKNIFEKFYEVGDALVHSSGDYAFKSGGLGLGLSTVKSILEEHGSSIDVESEIGKGSTFSFRVKLAT